MWNSYNIAYVVVNCNIHVYICTNSLASIVKGSLPIIVLEIGIAASVLHQVPDYTDMSIPAMQKRVTH